MLINICIIEVRAVVSAVPHIIISCLFAAAPQEAIACLDFKWSKSTVSFMAHLMNF